MKIVAVVPMKLNNERLPNKNTLSFKNGKPLCNYILDTLLAVKGIHETYVYCSDDRIIPYLPNNVRYLKRSSELDSSTTSMNEVLKAFAVDVHSDIYILAHATAPFILPISIEEALFRVISGENDSAFSVIQLNEFLWTDKGPLNYDLANIPRTQDLPRMFAETSGFYIFRRGLLEAHNRRIGFNPYKCFVDKIQAIDIDDKHDFILADAIYQTLKDDYFKEAEK